MAMSVSMLLSVRFVAMAAGFAVAVAVTLSTLLSMCFVAVAAGFAIAVAVAVVVIMLMVVLTSTRFMPVGTGFTVFVTFCFGMAGVRHGGFLVRFVV